MTDILRRYIYINYLNITIFKQIIMQQFIEITIGK